jgi:hypothetical protein
MTLVRRNHSRGHSYELDGAWAPGATTLIGAGYPRPALINWAGTTTAEYAIDHWSELEGMAVSERLERLIRSRYEERDKAAKRGTEVHDLAQALLAGREIVVPEELDGHVQSYLRFDEEWDVRELLVETVIAKRKPRYCGTLDMIADLADGRRWLVDLKTTRSGVFAENALQLAAYRYADFYLDADGNERPMPEVDVCGVVWIRADGYDLYPVRAGADEFTLFQMVARIARFQDRKLAEKYGDRDEVVGAPLTRSLEVST